MSAPHPSSNRLSICVRLLGIAPAAMEVQNVGGGDVADVRISLSEAHMVELSRAFSILWQRLR